MAIPDGLLESVRNYNDITWDDPGEDAKLTGMIARGMRDMDRLAGEPLDYLAEDKPRELLLDYTMYARAKSLSEFWVNYRSEIIALQAYKEVERYDAAQTADI